MPKILRRVGVINETNMKKSVLYCIVMLTILLTSCRNETVVKIVDAYEDATHQLDEASNDEECAEITKTLLDNLCDIVKTDPEFLKKAENKDFSKSDIKQMETAYENFNNKLKEKTDKWAWMASTSLVTVKRRLNENSQRNEVSYDGIADKKNDSDDDEKASSSGSEDWDELLESYEEYVDKYISYLKKASEGDMTALSEYHSVMGKAQEFSNKMKNAESDMSAEQWAKYNKITMKMLEAAQQMKE